MPSSQRTISAQDRDNPEMNVVGKLGAYNGHEPTHKLSKGFADGPIDSARLSISDAFAGIDFLSVGNRYRQNKQLLRVLGGKKFWWVQPRRRWDDKGKRDSSRVVLVRSLGGSAATCRSNTQ